MKKKSALLVSISMVLVAVLALTTASFAWFTASMNPIIDGFDVQVTTTNALLIGVRKSDKATTDPKVQDIKDIEFKTSLSVEDLIAGYVAANTDGTTVTGSKPNELLQGSETVKEIADLGIATGSDSATYKYALGDVTPKTITNAGGTEAITAKLISLAGGAIEYERLIDYDKTPDFTWLTDNKPGEDGDQPGYDTIPYEDATNAKGKPVETVKKDYDTNNKTIRTDYMNFDIYFKANFSTITRVNVGLDLTSVDTKGTVGTIDDVYTGSDFYPLKKNTGADAATNPMVRMTVADSLVAGGSSYWITTAMRTAFVVSKVQNATGGAVTETPALKKVMELDDRTATNAIINKTVDSRKEYNIDYKRPIDATSGMANADTANLELFEMDNSSIYKMSVFLWIEGNDAQCISNISAGMFRSKFKFVGTDATPVAP